MHIVDEIFRDFRSCGYLEDLKKLRTIDEKYKKIRQIVSRVNVFKAEIQDLTSEETLYLDCLIQEKGVDMNLCPFFNIFYSNKNQKFHHVCKKDNSRAYCKGDKNKCPKEQELESKI